MRLIVVVGARPNVVKLGPLIPELEAAHYDVDVAFTGSRSASSPDGEAGRVSFFGVEFPEPKWFFDIGSGTEAILTGRAMAAFEVLFASERPDAVMVVGDVSPTLAAAVSAAKAGIPVVHLEAGLRCGDLRFPEEINRVLVSRIAAMHLTPTESALETLEDEGVEPERIHFVGNMMAESVLRHLEQLGRVRPCEELGCEAGKFVLASFHRPENLASAERLAAILNGLAGSSLPVLAPDTGELRAAARTNSVAVPQNVRVLESVPYQTMLALERDAAAVVTDSSGVQEEACMVCTPCLTVRECTEHAATVSVGSNTLVPADATAIGRQLAETISVRHSWKTPKRWDKAVSHRVVRALKRGVIPLE